MEKFRPRTARKPTAARKVSSEMTLKTSAYRMNGMVRRILKNSIVSGFPSSFPSRIADGELGHLAAVAVDQVDDGARHGHRREHRGEDAEAVHHREAAHRPLAED